MAAQPAPAYGQSIHQANTGVESQADYRSNPIGRGVGAWRGATLGGYFKGVTLAVVPFESSGLTEYFETDVGPTGDDAI